MHTLLTVILTGLLKNIGWINQWHEKSKAAYKKKYKKEIGFEKIRIRRYNYVEIIDLQAKDELSGYCLKAQVIGVRWSFRRLFRPADRIRLIRVKNAEISLIKTNTAEKPVNASIATKMERQYWRGYRILRQLIKRIPSSLELTDVRYTLDTKTTSGVWVKQLLILDQSFKVEAVLKKNGITHSLESQGQIEGAIKEGLFTLHSKTSTYKKQTPQSEPLTVEAHDLQWKVDLQWSVPKTLTYKTNLQLSNLLVANQPLVHRNPRSKGFEASLTGQLDQAGFHLDKNSTIQFNHLQFVVGFEQQFSTSEFIKFDLTLNPCTISDLLRSLPPFQYKDIYTASFGGAFGFTSFLKIPLQPPHNYDFKVKVNSTIALEHAGCLDLNYLKASFLHTIHDQGKPLEQVLVGAENTQYIPLSQCALHFKQAIVIAEDRNFYKHQGIDIPSVGLALVTNLATKKITRGGGTITMQLVRNLLLHQKRSILKKIEEVLLAWLVEDIFRIGKDRILEIYLNIIEFAPGIYGIENAANHYFSKSASDLSLTESLILTYVVPRPKHFIQALSDGSLILVENLEKHLETMTAEMFNRGLITKEDIKKMVYEIEFSNGLGRIHLKDRSAQLHKVLSATFKAASKLWAQRYKHQPLPFICCTYRSKENQQKLYNQGRTVAGSIVTYAQPGKSPHNYLPSLAFDIVFKNQLGVIDRSAALFEKFAELVAEVDVHKLVLWGGHFTNLADVPHFELVNWRELIEQPLLMDKVESVNDQINK